jgi:erythromycin esterase-like protein
MVNLGQLLRMQNAANEVLLVGFASYHGSVLAARAWGSQPECMTMPAAEPDSWEDLMHRIDGRSCLFMLDQVDDDEALTQTRGHRSIGVIYHPERERSSNYVPTALSQRYNAMIFLASSQAAEPLAFGAR